MEITDFCGMTISEPSGNHPFGDPQFGTARTDERQSYLLLWI